MKKIKLKSYQQKYKEFLGRWQLSNRSPASIWQTLKTLFILNFKWKTKTDCFPSFVVDLDSLQKRERTTERGRNVVAVCQLILSDTKIHTHTQTHTHTLTSHSHTHTIKHYLSLSFARKHTHLHTHLHTHTNTRTYTHTHHAQIWHSAFFLTMRKSSDRVP